MPKGSTYPVATTPDAIDLLGVQGAVTKKLPSTLLATQGELDAHGVSASAHTGTYVGLTGDETVAGGKTFTSNILFRGNPATGSAADFGGTIDANAVAGTYYRAPMSLTAIDGNNGTRGDSIASDTAVGVGGTSFNGFYSNSTGASAFADKGSLNQYVAFGTLSPYSGGGDVYGELGGFVASLTNNRTGGLVEGFEAVVASGTSGAPVQGRNAAYVAVMNEHNAAITYWNRGYWAASQGTQKAGDAFYAAGSGGWTNFIRCLHTDATQRFRLDLTGKLYIGAGARTLYDDGSNLHADGTLVVDSLFSGGGVFGSGFFRASDSTRQVIWVAGSPEGVTVAAVGSIALRTDGAAATTLYVKESGTGNTGWVAK